MIKYQAIYFDDWKLLLINRVYLSRDVMFQDYILKDVNFLFLQKTSGNNGKKTFVNIAMV